MTQVRTMVLSFGVALAAVYGMPEKFGRDPASTLKATPAEFNLAKRKSVRVQPMARSPQAIETPVQKERELAPSAKKVLNPEVHEVDGFKQSLHAKLESDARWTRFFQGKFIQQLADCTVDAGRRTLDDRQIENLISEAGTDAHRALMFCAVRGKADMVAAGIKNPTSKPVARVNSSGVDEVTTDSGDSLTQNTEAFPPQAGLGVRVQETLSAPLEAISPVQPN
jgi:hypothetical protein